MALPVTGVTQPKVVAGQAYLQTTLTAPPDSPAATATIDRARATVHAVPGADAKVGGTPRPSWTCSAQPGTTVT